MTHSKGQINQTENKYGDRSIEQHIRTEGPNRHLHKSTHKSSRIHIFLKCTWNVFKNRSYTRPQKSLRKLKKIEIVPTTFSDHKGMKLEINYAKKMKNPTNTWRLHNILLNNQWINAQIKPEIKQYTETNDNNSSPQSLWDAMKAMQRGKYIAIQDYLRKEEQSHMNNLNSQLMKLEKEEQRRPKVSRQRDNNKD